jgi:hypothetical protein
LRQIPSGWRDEILGVAQAAAGAEKNRSGTRIRLSWREWPVLGGVKLWRELFWPSRYVWGGIAAAWLTMLAVNESIYEGGTSAQAKTASSAEVIQAVQVQRRLLAELAGPVVEREATRPKNDRPRPHSQRETDFALT